MADDLLSVVFQQKSLNSPILSCFVTGYGPEFCATAVLSALDDGQEGVKPLVLIRNTHKGLQITGGGAMQSTDWPHLQRVENMLDHCVTFIIFLLTSETTSSSPLGHQYQAVFAGIFLEVYQHSCCQELDQKILDTFTMSVSLSYYT